MHLLNVYLAKGEQGDTGFQSSNVVSPRDTLAANSASRLCLPLYTGSLEEGTAYKQSKEHRFG